MLPTNRSLVSCNTEPYNRLVSEFECLGLLTFLLSCALFGGLAQLARALAWQARGHRFESGILHNKAQANTVPRGAVFFVLYAWQAYLSKRTKTKNTYRALGQYFKSSKL